VTLVRYRATLTQYLIEQRRLHPEATGAFNDLILAVAQACKAIAKSVAYGSLAGVGGGLAAVCPPQEDVRPLVEVAQEAFVRATEWEGVLAGLASAETEAPICIAEEYPRGSYLLVFDPLDGFGKMALNVSMGSFFSVLRAPTRGTDPHEADFLQPGAEQVAAGYAIYGPSTMLVLTVGNGVVGFTLDPEIGEFLLTHPEIRIPETTCEFAINSSNSRFWQAPVKRYVEECLAGATGPRGKDFNMRWVASLVAEVHSVLMRGGVFLFPRDTKEATKPGRLHLLFECDPIGMLVEQAGGRASTGETPVLDVVPTALGQRTGFVFGSKAEVELIEEYHRTTVAQDTDAETPLFNTRGLFRTPD